MSQVLCYFLLKVLHVQWKKLSRRLRCKIFFTFNVIIKQFRIKIWILHTIFYKNNDMKARSIMGTEDGLPPPSPHFFSQQTYFLNLHKKKMNYNRVALRHIWKWWEINREVEAEEILHNSSSPLHGLGFFSGLFWDYFPIFV